MNDQSRFDIINEKSKIMIESVKNDVKNIIDIKNYENLTNVKSSIEQLIGGTKISLDPNKIDKIQNVNDQNNEILKQIAGGINHVLWNHPNKNDTNLLVQSNQTIQSELSSIKTEVEKFTSKYCSSSQKRGVFGEEFLANLLIEEFPDTQWLDTRRIPHSADFTAIHHDRKIIIDSKWFKGTVTGINVEKIKTEMETTKADVGIIISYESSFPFHKRMGIEKLGSKRLIFVPNANREAIVWSIVLAKNLVETTNMSIETDRSQRVYHQFIINHQNYLQNIDNQLRLCRGYITSLQASIDNISREGGGLQSMAQMAINITK